MGRRTVFQAAILVFCSAGCRDEAAPSPVHSRSASSDPALLSFLDYYESRYDSEVGMLLVEFSSPGYHSRIEAGTPVHPTRESLIYAVALLRRGTRGDDERAATIVRGALGLQDVDPDSKTCGVWPWLLEEPIGEMESPDLNWADFCGALLAQMLVDHASQLPGDLQEQMRESLALAAQAIRKRDVGPSYTNIAIIGGCVCAVCGELVDDADLLDYGRRRLQRVVTHTEEQGSFNEYNSPPYTCVAVGECERTLQIARDPETREAAEALRRTAWRIIAESFHPGTQQWAGPHSRTSRERLRPRTVEFLTRRTGVDLRVHPSMVVEDMPSRYAVVDALPCPEEFVDRFRSGHSVPRQLERTFIRGESPAETIVGTTWLDGEFCLGSVNRATFWTQRKPLLGYWRTNEDPAVVFRARFLHEGRDFASMGISTAQQGPRLVSLIGPVAGQGDWHPSLDRPADGVFEATDLRLRCELRGVGIKGEWLSDGQYALSAGQRRVVIFPLPGRFAGRDVTWEAGSSEDHVYLDAVCYHGEPRDFDFNSRLSVVLGMGIEVIAADEPPAQQSPATPVRRDGDVTTHWMVNGAETINVRRAETVD